MTNYRSGSTDQSIDVFVGNSSVTTGAGLTGLAYNTSGLTCYFRKGATGTATALSLATQTVGGAHTDGGFVEIDSTNAPGLYRLDLSDTILADRGRVSIYLHGATNMRPVALTLQVDAPVGSGIIEGKAAGTPSTTSMNTDLTGYANDELIGGLVVFVSGTAKGQRRTITDYASTSGVVTFAALQTAAAADDEFVIV